jgi:hypothetical protein
MARGRRSLTIVVVLVSLLLVAALSIRNDLYGFHQNPYTIGYGDARYGATVVAKFGENPDVDNGTAEDVWDCPELGAPVVYPFSNAAYSLYLSSSSALDTSQTISVTGLDENWNAQTVTLTATGQTFTQVGSASGWRRVNRAFNAGSATPEDALAGDLYLATDNTDAGGDGIPDTLTSIKACIRQGKEQTLMAIWTAPDDYVTYIDNWCGSVVPGGVTPGEKVAKFTGYARANSPLVGTLRPQTTFGLASRGTGMFCKRFQPPLWVPERTDLKGTVGNDSTNNTFVSATFDVLLFKK